MTWPSPGSMFRDPRLSSRALQSPSLASSFLPVGIQNHQSSLIHTRFHLSYVPRAHPHSSRDSGVSSVLFLCFIFKFHTPNGWLNCFAEVRLSKLFSWLSAAALFLMVTAQSLLIDA